MKMKAVGLFEFGDPDVLRVVDVKVPDVPDGAVLVRVDATPINPTDLTFRRGGRAAQLEDRPRPLIPGVDFAGHVAAIGGGATGRLAVGDPVLGIAKPWGPWTGSYARFVLADERSVVHAPNGVPLAEASTLLLNAITARMALDALDVDKGQTVLITGAAGAVSGYALQMAHRRGAHTVTIASAQDYPLLRGWGANTLIERGPDAVKQIQQKFPNGVDSVVDGADLKETVVPAVRIGGKIATLKFWRADLPDVKVIPILAPEQATNTTLLEEFVSAASRGELDLRVSKLLPYTQAAEAHRMLEAGGVRGRVVLDFSTAN